MCGNNKVLKFEFLCFYSVTHSCPLPLPTPSSPSVSSRTFETIYVMPPRAEILLKYLKDNRCCCALHSREYCYTSQNTSLEHNLNSKIIVVIGKGKLYCSKVDGFSHLPGSISKSFHNGPNVFLLRNHLTFSK